MLPSNGAGQGELQACNSRRRPARPGARGEFQSGGAGAAWAVHAVAGARFLKYPRGRLAFKCIGAIGAVVARFVHTEEVTGSNPVSPTAYWSVSAHLQRKRTFFVSTVFVGPL